MKILMINKFYYIKGGSETYLFSLKRIMEKKGHEVISFSMKDEKNFHTEYDEYFIDNIDYLDKNVLNKFKNATKVIYNFDANRKLRKLIRKTKPDIAHLHIFQHQMSPSILKVLKEENIPIIYTVHDLKAICLNYKMLNRGKVCEQCKGGKLYKCIINKCVKDSIIKSLINVIEGYTHKILKSYSMIDKFITPSNFYRNKLIEYGIPKKKVEFIPNFIDIDKFDPNYTNKGYYLYLGRLSEEKGIETLIKAFEQIPTAKLKIVGTGPMDNKLKEYVIDKKIKNIKFEGFKQGKELENIIKFARFLVIPSEWYENCPMSVIECMAYGKPIIGANIGGIPELIGDSAGYTYKSRDVNELVDILNMTLNLDDNQLKNISLLARKRAEELFGEEKHYSEVIKLYNEYFNEN